MYKKSIKPEKIMCTSNLNSSKINAPIYTSGTPIYTSNAPIYTSNAPIYTSNAPVYTNGNPKSRIKL